MLIARVRLSLQTFAAGALIACAHSHTAVPSPPGRAEVSAVSLPECYTLSYTDSTRGKESRLYPKWIEISPGSDSGAAAAHGAAMSEADWKYSGWKRIAGDSLEIMFTSTAEGMRIHVARLNGALDGRATWLTDIVGLPTTSLPLVGTRASCPEVRPATI
ncbi:MAG: hypothetical protein DMD72_07975 [Gemmatimonadetes bacterium]|nr:MAG: hypothetical protein DMD72_07975 [Gemmatimonadota bacterium]